MYPSLTPSRRQRYIRFSIPTLLIAIAVIAAYFGGYAAGVRHMTSRLGGDASDIRQELADLRGLFEDVRRDEKAARAVTLARGRRIFPEITEFEETFPRWIDERIVNHDNYIWQFTAGVHGRYLVRMTLEGSFEQEAGLHLPVARSNVRFDVSELARVEMTGTSRTIETKSLRQITRSEWDRLVKRRGDLSTLGIDVIRDQSVKGFELVFSRKR